MIVSKNKAMKKRNNTLEIIGAALVMAFFIWIGMQIEKRVGIQTPEKTYTKTEVHYFSPGDTLSSKENGALILWEEWMGPEMIVGVVTDSGTINTNL